MMENKYVKPEIKITEFDYEDVIMTSGTTLIIQEQPQAMINNLTAKPLEATNASIFDAE